MSERGGKRCPFCACYCRFARGEVAVCPGYYPLRDALFPGGIESIPEPEDRILRWLAGMCDQPSRDALVSLFGRVLGAARQPTGERGEGAGLLHGT